MKVRIALLPILVASGALAAEPDVEEQQPSNRLLEIVERYVDDDTLVVAVAEVDGAWVSGLQQEIARHSEGNANKLPAHPGFALAHGFVESFRAAGVREVVLLAALHDLHASTGPLLILTIDADQSADAVRELAAHYVQTAPDDLKDLQVTKGHLGCVLVGKPATVERYHQLTASPRADIAAALTEQLAAADNEEGPSAVAVVAPGADARRVMRALWPSLPAPFERLDGELVASVRHIGGRVACPPNWQAELRIETTNQSAASEFQRLLQRGWQEFVEVFVRQQPSVEAIALEATALLEPSVKGNSVVVRIAHDDPQFAELIEKRLLRAAETARADAVRKLQMKPLKQMALAMHKFHDTQAHFPAAAAIVDADGKPLLSWRVALLPHLDQSDLYRQFHLDEPWNSPHNLELVKKMPDVFATRAWDGLNREGKTNYQVPVHPQSAFPPAGEQVAGEKAKFGDQEYHLATGLTFRAITDGASHTVMIVESPPEDAVIWTRPADWEVDLAKAWQQLTGEDRSKVLAAFCDGSVRVLAADRENLDKDEMAERMQAYITRNGREVVQ